MTGVAVVIPVHNRPTILLETLGYVFQQAMLPDKLIIVDDGSTDDTADRAEAWLSNQSTDVDWEIVRNSKSTVGETRNVGFERVGDSPFVAFLDSDDHWPADFLERCVATLHANPDCVLATVEREYRGFGVEVDEHKGGQDLVNDPVPWIFVNGAALTSSTLLRVGAVHEVGGWPDYDVAEDTEFFCALSVLGPWAFSPGNPVVHNVGNSLARNEEGNLSRKFECMEVLWGERLGEIYNRLRWKLSRRERRLIRPHIALHWYRAGRYYKKKEQWREMKRCFVKSLRWEMSFKYLKYSFKSIIGRIQKAS